MTPGGVLTHPLDGFFRRRDGDLGTYSVWHERLAPTPGRVRHARIGLFDRLGIVPFAEQTAAHSVLIQSRTELPDRPAAAALLIPAAHRLRRIQFRMALVPPAGGLDMAQSTRLVRSDGNLAVGVFGAAVLVGLGVAAVTYARDRSAHRNGGVRRQGAPPWPPTSAST